MANEFGNTTIWDKVFADTGDEGKAWEAYWNADASTRDNDINTGASFGGDKGYSPEEQKKYKQTVQTAKDFNVNTKSLSDYDNDAEKWYNDLDKNLQKASEIKGFNDSYYDDLYSMSDKNLNDFVNIDAGLNNSLENNDEEIFKRANQNRKSWEEANSILNPIKDLNTGLVGDNAAAKHTAENLSNQLKRNINQGKNLYDNIEATLLASDSNKDSYVDSPNGPIKANSKYSVNNIDDLNKVVLSEYFDQDINSENFDKIINEKITEAANSDKKNDRLLNQYWSQRSKSNIDPRYTDNTAENTSNAWTKLWDERAKWYSDGHAYDRNDFNKFYRTKLTQDERALLEKDIANNAGYESWADMWDVTDGGQNFEKVFKALETGEDGVYGMKELSPEQVEKSAGGNQRYHGQDLMEQLFGRNADQRTVNAKKETKDNNTYYTFKEPRAEGNYQMASNRMGKATGNENSTIDAYLRESVDNAQDLSKVLKDNPELIKSVFAGDNTYTLNDLSKKLVTRGLNSPLFNTSAGDMSLPEADLYGTLLSSGKSIDEDKLKNGEYRADDFMDQRMIDYSTGLLNTYLNAADLANQNTRSGYSDDAAVRNANEQAINNYLNYYENEDYKDKGGNLSYNVFDDGDRFSFSGTGKENGDIDLSALYNTSKKTSDVQKILKNNGSVGVPFNTEMLRKTINKGRRG